MTSTATGPAEAGARPAGSRIGGLIAAAFSLVAGGTVLALSQGINEPTALTSFSPRWWPEALGGILLSLGLLTAIQAWIRPGAEEEQEPSTRRGAVRIALILISIATYGVLWYFIDFRVTTFLLFAVMVMIGGGRSWKAYLLFPAIATAVLYVFFGLLLKVPL